MKKPRRMTAREVELEDLGPDVAKMHFHTDAELMALIRFYAGAIRETVDAVGLLYDRRQMAHDVKRYTGRLLALIEEIK